MQAHGDPVLSQPERCASSSNRKLLTPNFAVVLSLRKLALSYDGAAAPSLSLLPLAGTVLNTCTNSPALSETSLWLPCREGEMGTGKLGDLLEATLLLSSEVRMFP